MSECDNTGDFCSFNASEDSQALKYWSCPRNPDICGADVLIDVDKSGIELELTLAEASALEFTNGEICTY